MVIVGDLLSKLMVGSQAKLFRRPTVQFNTDRHAIL